MTSRRPYWCPKPILWELNTFLMQTLSFVPIKLHRCWPCEWKHSIYIPYYKISLASFVLKISTYSCIRSFIRIRSLSFVSWSLLSNLNHRLNSFPSKYTLELMVYYWHLPNLVNTGWFRKNQAEDLSQSETAKYFELIIIIIVNTDLCISPITAIQGVSISSNSSSDCLKRVQTNDV